MIAEPRHRLSARTILKMVILTVLGTLVLWYVSAVSSFAGNTYSFNNRFTEVAIRDHWWYLLWSNVVVLKGYGLVAIGYVFLIYPIVLIWHRWRPFGKWGCVWRTSVMALGAYGFFIFRLLREKPYFGDYRYMENWFSWIGGIFGSTLEGFIHVLVMQVFPLVALTFAILFYANEWRRRSGARALALGSAMAVLVVFAASGYGLNKETTNALAGIKSEPKPKNILIIGSDSLRGDRLSCNGHSRPTSPSIDQLAAGGVNFHKCLTPIASTLESLTSIYSGQYPHTHGIYHMFPNLEMVQKVNKESPNLAGTLRQHGYDTAVVGDWCACGFNELPMGFEDIIVSDFDNFRIYMSEVVFLHHQILPLFFDNRIGHILFPKLKSFANYMTPDVVTDQVIDRLKRRSEDGKPFLIFAYYSCTHLPYKTPRQYSELWADPEYEGKHKHELALNVDEFIGSTDINEKWSKFPPKEVEQVRALYDGCVRMFDDCVGRLTSTLKEEGLMDNTIVLVTGDHGDDLFEPNTTFGHGLTFNGGDQNNHVPAVFHIPGVKQPGSKIDKLVRTIDFAPTLCELVGIQPDSRFEGRSLVPYINGKTDAMHLAYFGETSYLFFKRKIPGEEPLHIPPMDETTFIDPDFDYHFVLKPKYQDAVLKTKERCIRTERFKLVRTPGSQGDIIRLFDLKADKHCENDVKDQFPEVAERMKRALDRFITTKQESNIREILGDIDENAIVPRK